MNHAAVLVFALVFGAAPALAQDSDAAGEAEILARINAMRNAAGLGALERDARLDAAARTHSADMAWHSMLAHVSPRTGDPSDRVRAAGLEPEALAENIAQAADAVAAHQSLVASERHRANMMSDRFTHIGISVMPADGAVFVTEVFASIEEAPAEQAPPPAVAPAPDAIDPWADGDAEPPAAPAPAPVPERQAIDPWAGRDTGPPAAAPPAPAPGHAGAVEAQPLPPDAPTFQAPPQQGERRVAGYWVFAQGRWWYYPLPPDARPGQVLQPAPGVTGPPPGTYRQPGYRVYPYPQGYRQGYRYYGGPPPAPPAFGWSPRRRYEYWRAR